MKTFTLQVLGLFIVIVAGLVISTNRSGGNPFFNLFPLNNNNTANQLMIISSEGQTKARLDIELAETQEAKTRGLGGRDYLASNAGMLFVYQKADQYKFWMKGMRFPLDFIWIKDNSIVDLLPNIPPPSGVISDAALPVYTSVVPANKILEVNAGFIAAHNLQVGDLVNF